MILLRIKLLIGLAVIATNIFAQCDTLVIYSVADSTTQFIAVECNPDSVNTHGQIIGNVGTMGNSTILIGDSAPSSKFTSLSIVEGTYDLLSYPIRTNVALVWSDSIVEQGATCSGALISKNIVLTAGHCIGKNNSFNTFIWTGGKGLYISPAHTHGYPQNEFGKIKVNKIIIQKKYYDNNNYQDDFALLVLDKPIGDSIGWLGTSYYEGTDSLFNDSLISYNFSYPATNGYDGKNMFYNYGHVFHNYSQGFFTGVPGIVGQSGSNVFNIDNGNPITYGIISHSSGSSAQGYFLTKEKFWGIQNMVSVFNNALGVSKLSSNISTVEIYPVPTKNFITLNHLLENDIFQIEIIDLYGQRLLIEQIQNNSENISISELPNSIYMLILHSNTGNIAIKIVKN